MYFEKYRNPETKNITKGSKISKIPLDLSKRRAL